MKLFSVTFLLAAVVLASLQVAATPIRVIELSASRTSGNPFRLGHAAAYAVNLSDFNGTAPPPAFPSHHGHHHMHHQQGAAAFRGSKKWSCKMRKQALKISNWFRFHLGLAPIEPMHHHMHPHGAGPKMMPHHPRPIHGGAIQIIPLVGASANVSAEGQMQQVKVDFMPFAEPPHMHRFRPATFSGRLHKALMVLGPWEGRAMAFVLGCGIGSLIRMFWVLAVLAFRTSRPTENRIELVDAEVIFEEELEVPATQPPQYEEKADGKA